MRAFLLVFALLALAPLAGPLHAQNSGLDRLATRERVLGWEAVGRLDLPQGYCTGVLIATDLVLTAAHCMFNPLTGTYFDPGQMRFSAGLADGRAIAIRQGLRQVSHPDYIHAAGLTADNVRRDVALVQLASPIPAATAAPFTVGTVGGRGTPVSVVSYGEGRDDAPSWQRVCTVIGHGGGLIGFDCDVVHGSSGAPVFDRSGSRARIVSLVSAGNGRDAYGMELPALVDEVKAALRAGRGVIEAAADGDAAAVFVTPGTRSTGGAKFVPASP